MQENFKNYLINQGYKETTPSGNPSTVYDYVKRVDRIRQHEDLSWIALAEKISTIVMEYDVGGQKQNLGDESHKAVINALKRFEEFVKNGS